MMSEDYRAGYREGYDAARRYYQGAEFQREKVLRAWNASEKEKVRGLVEKHWPELTAAISALQYATNNR